MPPKQQGQQGKEKPNNATTAGAPMNRKASWGDFSNETIDLLSSSASVPEYNHPDFTMGGLQPKQTLLAEVVQAAAAKAVRLKAARNAGLSNYSRKQSTAMGKEGAAIFVAAEGMSKNSNANKTSSSSSSVSPTNKIVMPAVRAREYYEKAKRLYSHGGGSCVVLERIQLYITRAISFAPTEPKYYLFLSRVLRLGHDWSGAVYCLRYLLRIQPDHFLGKKDLAMLLKLRGQEQMCEAIHNSHDLVMYDKARVHFDESLLFDKENPHSWLLKCICHVHQRQWTDALSSVNKSIICYAMKINLENNEIEKQPAEIMILKAKLLWALGLIEDGNKQFRIAVPIISLHPEVKLFANSYSVKSERLYKLAMATFAMGRYEDTLRYINFAIDIAENDVKLHVVLSKTHRLMGNFQEAYNAIQRAATIFRSASDFPMELPDDISRQTNLVFNDMALNYASQGIYDKAIALLSKVIQSEKQMARGLRDVDFRFYLNRGDCYRALGKTEQSIMDYKIALDLQPTNKDIRTRVAIVHYLIGSNHFNESNYFDCESEMTHAIEANDDVHEFYAVRGKARYLLGKHTEAYHDFKKAFALNPDSEEMKARLLQFDGHASEGGVGGMKAGNSQGQNKSDTTSPDLNAAPLPVDKREKILRKLVVKKENMVDMMLHPHKAKELPVLHMLRASSADDKERAPQPRAITFLPKVNPRLELSSVVSHDCEVKDKQLHSLLEIRGDTKKEERWKMLKIVSESAAKIKIPFEPPPEDIPVKGKGLPSSATALKRYSERMTKKYLKDPNRLIAGVFTTSKDPALRSLAPKPRKFNLTALKPASELKDTNKNDGSATDANAKVLTAKKKKNVKTTDEASEVNDNADEEAVADSSNNADDADRAREIASSLGITTGESPPSSSSREVTPSTKKVKGKKKSKRSKSDKSDPSSREERRKKKNKENSSVDPKATIDKDFLSKISKDESKLAALLDQDLSSHKFSTESLIKKENESRLLMSYEEELELLYQELEREQAEKRAQLSMQMAMKGKKSLLKGASNLSDDDDEGGGDGGGDDDKSVSSESSESSKSSSGSSGSDSSGGSSGSRSSSSSDSRSKSPMDDEDD